MLRVDWKPSKIADVERKWNELRLPVDGEIDPNKASQLMIQFEAMAQDYADEYANATLYEETREWEAKGKYHVAFMKSIASSDRKKEAEAKSDEKVRVAEIMLIEARAATLLTKMKYEAAVRASHAAKALLRAKEQEKWL